MFITYIFLDQNLSEMYPWHPSIDLSTAMLHLDIQHTPEIIYNM
jgi:hypothetical protein